MKKSCALLIVLVLCLGVVSPALAYSGVSGVVVDSLTLAPWTWGGDVMVINRSTNGLLAMCSLDSGGNIVAPGGVPATTCTYGATYFGPWPFVPPLALANIEITIDFHCNMSGLCSGGPAGTPNPLTLNYAGDPATPGQYVIPPPAPETGTGPNAVQLSGMSSASSLSLALVLALVAGGSVLIRNKLDKDSKPVYISPEIIHEGALEVKAGSSTSDIMDELTDQLK